MSIVIKGGSLITGENGEEGINFYLFFFFAINLAIFGNISYN